jgi:Holliday junction resolvasome RuvABC DNA-binding subunit
MARVQRDMEHFRNGEFEREMAKAREEIRRSMQEVDREMQHLKAAGVDPEEIKAELREALAEVERINVDEIVREALASVDMDEIRADLHDAGKSLDDVERRLDEDDHH